MNISESMEYLSAAVLGLLCKGVMVQFFQCTANLGRHSYPQVQWSSFITRYNGHTATRDGLDLLSKMLVWDHRLRISAEEALVPTLDIILFLLLTLCSVQAHPYFDVVRNLPQPDSGENMHCYVPERI